MKIIKYCEPRYNIYVSNFIQLGTLEYYREHEKDEIKDSTEGTHSLILESDDCGPKDISIIDGNGRLELLQGAVFLPGFRDQIKLGYSTLGNVYIFCASKLKDGDNYVDTGNQLGYQSYYEINDPQSFANKVKELLFLQLKKYGYSDVEIECIHGDVVYVDERVTRLSDSGFKNLSSPGISDTVFTKECCFKNNNEYRFAWFINNKEGGQIKLNNETLYVESGPLKSFVK